MEIWDILDENGEKTGRTMLRGDPQKPGEYYLAVHIWIRNGRGEYLIQKRADDKPLWPGFWAVTGGAAIAGESSMETVLREIEEELGVKADPDRLRLVDRQRWKGWFTDVWLLEQDFPLENVIIQPEEVSAVMWASVDTIREMAKRGEFVQYSYLDAFLN